MDKGFKLKKFHKFENITNKIKILWPIWNRVYTLKSKLFFYCNFWRKKKLNRVYTLKSKPFFFFNCNFWKKKKIAFFLGLKCVQHTWAKSVLKHGHGIGLDFAELWIGKVQDLSQYWQLSLKLETVPMDSCHRARPICGHWAGMMTKLFPVGCGPNIGNRNPCQFSNLFLCRTKKICSQFMYCYCKDIKYRKYQKNC